MILSDIISVDRTACAVNCQSKKRIFEIISDIACQQQADLDPDDVLASLISREKMGSTGIGNGIALPHGRIDGLDDVLAVVVTSDTPIEFDAIDNQAVDIFFAILVPSEETQAHLQTLAMIAQKLSDKHIVKLIRQAQSRQDILAALDIV